MIHEGASAGLWYPQWSYAIQGAAFEVYRELGAGFLEKVYETALVAELSSRGLAVRAQVPHSVQYKGRTVGDYFADIVVEKCIVIEVKSQPLLHAANCAQLLNYLAVSGLHLGYLINFHYPRATVRRFVR